jgi:hypothetical protein
MSKKRYLVKNPNAGLHKYELTGKRFGLLTVEKYIGLNNSKNKVWRCKCDCGNYCNVTTTYLNNGKTSSCKCNRYKKGSGVYNYTGYKDITGTKWYSIKTNARIRQLEFTITKEDVWVLLNKQNGKCYFSNLDISFKDKTASIDRLNSSLGYTNDNIALVHKDINRMKTDFSVEYFTKLCKLVANKIKK